MAHKHTENKQKETHKLLMDLTCRQGGGKNYDLICVFVFVFIFQAISLILISFSPAEKMKTRTVSLVQIPVTMELGHL